MPPSARQTTHAAPANGRVPRRTFLGQLASATIVPGLLASAVAGCAARHTARGAPQGEGKAPQGEGKAPPGEGKPPRVALIGCGGRGAENLGDLLAAGATIAALCDVSRPALDAAVARVATDRPGAAAPRVFADLRELLARRAELALDGVLVSTPDHTHAIATALALRAGLPVYCEKPLTHTLAESRRILELSRAARVPTQLGTQIHAGENYRRVVELVRAGAIGRITSCDCWVNRGWCCGETGPVASPPEGLDYDLWLGPARNAPYIEGLHPSNWRKYWAYGTGTLGDMGCHMLDLPLWALGLDRGVLGAVEVFAATDTVDRVACPEWTEASWAIPQRDATGAAVDPLVLRWFDNGRMSPTAQELGAKDRIDYHNRFSMVFQGTKGWLWANYGEHLVTPGALAEEVARMPRPAPIEPSRGHHREWLAAITAWRRGDRSAANAPLCAFEQSTVLNELVLSGTVAGRARRSLTYDFRTQAFEGARGDPIEGWHDEPRAGWSLDDRNLDRILAGRG